MLKPDKLLQQTLSSELTQTPLQEERCIENIDSTQTKTCIFATFICKKKIVKLFTKTTNRIYNFNIYKTMKSIEFRFRFLQFQIAICFSNRFVKTQFMELIINIIKIFKL